MRLLVLVVLLAGCGSVEVAVGPPDATTPCTRPCEHQVDCLTAELPLPAPCQEWGCPHWGACAYRCELGPVYAGQACWVDAHEGVCETAGGACR